VSVAPDLAHAAFAELGGDPVVGDQLVRAHSAISGMTSLPSRGDGNPEVMLVIFSVSGR
jgi:hypothetical protein